MKKLSLEENSLKKRQTRLEFIKNITEISEKEFLKQLKNMNIFEEQKDMLEFLKNTNISLHKINKRILSSKHYKVNNTDLCADFINKSLFNYITQFEKFPLLDGNFNHRIAEQLSDLKFNDNIIKFYRRGIIHLNEAYKNNDIVYNLSINDNKTKNNFLNCFSCFRKKVKPLQNLDSKNKTLSNSRSVIHLKEIENNSIQILPSLVIYNENHNIEKEHSHQIKKNKGGFFLNSSTTQDSDRKKNLINSDILLLKPKNIPKNNINNEKEVFHYQIEKMNFPFQEIGKNINFMITSDITKSILYIKNSSYNEYILNSFTFETRNNAFIKDLFFYEFYLRTNFQKLIISKNIKFPLILYGNVFFPEILFYRGDEEINFKLLENPIKTSLLIGQLLPPSFLKEFEKINLINSKVINDNIEIAEYLEYKTIIVNLLPFSENNQVFTIIKYYIDFIKNNLNYNVNEINFLLNITEEEFQNNIKNQELSVLLNNICFNSKIINI